MKKLKKEKLENSGRLKILNPKDVIKDSNNCRDWGGCVVFERSRMYLKIILDEVPTSV